MSLEKILAKVLLIASLTSCGGGGGGNNEAPTPPANRAPVASLTASVTSGDAPLNVAYDLTCTDPDGPNDLESSKFDAGNGEIFTGLPPSNRTIIYDVEGTYPASLTCTDKSNAQGQSTATITVTSPPIPPNPSITQTVTLNNFVDLDYTAEILNMDNATLEVTLNKENLIATRTINSGIKYAETFEDMEKGNYTFFLSGGGISDSKNIAVPNYNPELDLSSIIQGALDFYEDTEVRINFPSPTDKNPEDNPVLITVSSPDGKTNPRILENELVITNNQGETGDYTIEINYGNIQGGEGSANLNGNIANLTDISGQLQDNETDSGRHGFVRVYSLEKELLSEVRIERKLDVNENGKFSLRIPNPVPGYFLQARIVEVDGLARSYVRTREFNNGEDKENLVIRVVPYTGLAENEITPEQFKAYMSEIQLPHLRKWDLVGETSNPFQGIEIVDFSPATGDSFTLEEQNFIRDTMLANMSCYTGGMLTEENTLVQIDTGSEEVNYTYDSDLNIIPNSGWMIVVPYNLQLGGTSNPTFYGRQIIGVKIRMEVKFASGNRHLISHEQGHGFIAPIGHSISIPHDKTIMVGMAGSSLESPSEIDCKAGKLIYETNYTVMDSELPRYLGENQKEILDLEFGSFD